MAETVKTEKYTLFYKRLVHSTHIVRQDTGEEIAIPPETETLYSYMLDQYESYKARGKPFFESQESMGLKLKGRDRRWIAARIEVLNRLGLVKSEEQERDSYGHKRFHHTVIPLEEVSDNLLFYGPEKISGGPLAEGMLIRALEKKKPRGKPKSKKVAQSTTEESGNDQEKQPAAAPETAAPVAGKPDGLPVVDIPVDADVPANDDAVNASDRYTDEQLGTKLRRWRNWGLDEEAKAFCLSHGISSDEDSMKLFIQNYPVPAPASVEQQVNAPADELQLDYDDSIPF